MFSANLPYKFNHVQDGSDKVVTNISKLLSRLLYMFPRSRRLQIFLTWTFEKWHSCNPSPKRGGSLPVMNLEYVAALLRSATAQNLYCGSVFSNMFALLSMCYTCSWRLAITRRRSKAGQIMFQGRSDIVSTPRWMDTEWSCAPGYPSLCEGQPMHQACALQRFLCMQPYIFQVDFLAKNKKLVKILRTGCNLSRNIPGTKLSQLGS